MRTREEITAKQSGAFDSACYERNTVEVLLDIRDLLIEVKDNIKLISKR